MAEQRGESCGGKSGGTGADDGYSPSAGRQRPDRPGMTVVGGKALQTVNGHGFVTAAPVAGVLAGVRTDPSRHAGKGIARVQP